MLSDASEGFKDTWQYVDRRIDDMITVSRFKYEVLCLFILSFFFSLQVLFLLFYCLFSMLILHKAEQAVSSAAGKLFSLLAR